MPCLIAKCFVFPWLLGLDRAGLYCPDQSRQRRGSSRLEVQLLTDTSVHTSDPMAQTAACSVGFLDRIRDKTVPLDCWRITATQKDLWSNWIWCKALDAEPTFRSQDRRCLPCTARYHLAIRRPRR